MTKTKQQETWTMSNPNEPTILGLCNPLLDITAKVDEAFLKKHDLKANNAIMADDETICKDLVKNYPVTYTAGKFVSLETKIVLQTTHFGNLR